MEAKFNEYLKGIVANLPEKPGIYQYLNSEGTIIYVGKAKNLKKRVYSYFSKEHDDLLATGGTMKAACELVKMLKPKKVYVNFIIELKDLNGKAVFGDDVEVESVLTL